MPEIKHSDISDEDKVDSDDEIVPSNAHSKNSSIFFTYLNNGPQPKYNLNRNLKSFEEKFLGSSSEISAIHNDALTSSVSNISLLQIVKSHDSKILRELAAQGKTVKATKSPYTVDT